MCGADAPGRQMSGHMNEEVSEDIGSSAATAALHIRGTYSRHSASSTPATETYL